MKDGHKPHNKPQYGEVMHHTCSCIHCCPIVVAAAAAAAVAAVIVVYVLVSSFPPL